MSNLPTSSDFEETLPNPHPTATKKLRLSLNNGTILLRKLPFDQTSFTFSAQVKVSELGNAATTKTKKSTVTAKAMNSTKGSFSATSSKRFWSEDDKASDLFSKIATQFYERFKKEGVIDERMKNDFIDNIPNALPLTTDEQILIAGSMKLVEEISSKAKVRPR